MILWNYKLRLLLLDSNKKTCLVYINLTKKYEDIPEIETILLNAVVLDPENWDLNLQLIICGVYKGSINFYI